jgi:HSP20 family protein
MRYRRLSYRYAMTIRCGQAWSVAEVWPSDRQALRVQPRWRPDTDAYETPTTVEIIVDLAGVDEDDFEVQLFEDALVIEGRRAPPSCQEGAVYQAVGIRQGPFRVELPLAAPVDPERVEARFHRGLLRITLAKLLEAG